MLKKIGKNIVVQTVLGTLIAWYVRFVYKTSKWTIVNFPENLADGKKAVVLVFWHGRALGGPLAFFHGCFKGLEAHGLTSLHRDGRTLAVALEHMGIRVTGGSSRHGGASAGLSMIRALRKGRVLFGVAPDGSKPGFRMTKGAIVMAKDAGVPVVLQGYSTERRRICKTWDKFMIPYPFTRGTIVFSDPIDIPRDLDADGIEYWRVEMENKLNALNEEADRRVGLKEPSQRGKTRMSFFKFYEMMTVAASPLIAVLLAFRKSKGKEDMARFPERMGYPSAKRPEGKLVWIHGASVGETLSVLPLIRQIQTDHPQWTVMVTSGTVTSAKLMGERLTGNAFHQYVPVDLPSAAHRFVKFWKPDLALWIESEFWPNLLSAAKEEGVPVVLINGRVSDRSFKRWQRFSFFSRKLQSLFTESFGQTDEDARRLGVLGAAKTACVGNIKYGAGKPPCDGAELEKLQKLIGDRPCWIAASTHKGEEESVRSAHELLKKKYPGLLTVLAPRHPNRADEIAALLSGLNVARRSAGQEITPETDVYLADTIGEMGLFYRLASVAFVGGSLIPFGGQNMLEPAVLGKAVICGKYTMNFKEIVAKAKAEDALIEVGDSASLAGALETLFDKPELLAEKQKNAERFATAQTGVIGRLMTALKPYFEKE